MTENLGTAILQNFTAIAIVVSILASLTTIVYFGVNRAREETKLMLSKGLVWVPGRTVPGEWKKVDDAN